jgi:hypothetical protein
MPYVQRSNAVDINGVYALLQSGYAEEFLPDNDPEVVAFFAKMTANPPVLDARQFWTQMAVQGLINENEAVGALSGDIPNAIKQYINGLPTNQRFEAKMFFAASEFRHNSRVSADLRACFSLSAAALDQFFVQAGEL